VTLPLARVAYENEAFRRTQYIPPHLRVDAGDELGQACAQVAERLREKALFLSGRVTSAAMTGPMVLETKMMIQALVSDLPVFEALLNSRTAHPYALYLALCSLVGNLAGLGMALVPPALEPYDHKDPRSSFMAARDYLFRMIDEGVIEAYTVVPFKAKKRVFVLKLEEEWVGDRIIVGVRTRSDQHERDVVEWMEHALIGSRDVIPTLQGKRVLGAERERVEDEVDIVPPRGVVLFAIDPDPEFITPGETLVVANSMDTKGELTPLGVVCYVKNA
jgi:type VI secretion system protein ImpJ